MAASSKPAGLHLFCQTPCTLSRCGLCTQMSICKQLPSVLELQHSISAPSDKLHCWLGSLLSALVHIGSQNTELSRTRICLLEICHRRLWPNAMRDSTLALNQEMMCMCRLSPAALSVELCMFQRLCRIPNSRLSSLKCHSQTRVSLHAISRLCLSTAQAACSLQDATSCCVTKPLSKHGLHSMKFQFLCLACTIAAASCPNTLCEHCQRLTAFQMRSRHV